MEKEPQTELFSGIKVKEYPSDHTEVYVSEPPPAYKQPKNSLIEIVRIVALTIVAITITVSVYNLASIYVQANAFHRLQQLKNRHEQKINQIPEAESLIQQQSEISETKKLNPLESKNHVRRDFDDISNKFGDSIEDNNSIESDEDSESDSESKNDPDNLKFQLDFNDLPEALLGLNNNNNNNNNKKSRMNCIVEKKVAEKMVNHEPKNIQLPFGLNLTTDKGYEHLTGEKIIILCETGSEQQPQQQPQQPQPQVEQQPPQLPDQYFRQNIQPVPFIRNEPISMFPQEQQVMKQFIPYPPQIMEHRNLVFRRFPQVAQHQQPLQQPQQPIITFNPPKQFFPIKMNSQPEQPPQQQPEHMIFITNQRIPMQIMKQENRPRVILEKNPSVSIDESPVIPPLIKSITEEIIRERERQMQQQQQQQEKQEQQQIQGKKFDGPQMNNNPISDDIMPNPELLLKMISAINDEIESESDNKDSSEVEKQQQIESEQELSHEPTKLSDESVPAMENNKPEEEKVMENEEMKKDTIENDDAKVVELPKKDNDAIVGEINVPAKIDFQETPAITTLANNKVNDEQRVNNDEGRDSKMIVDEEKEQQPTNLSPKREHFMHPRSV